MPEPSKKTNLASAVSRPVLSSELGEAVSGRHRILFFGEGVTLAHASRPAVLAKALSSDHYEILFATPERYKNVLGNLPFAFHALQSMENDRFLSNLAGGRPMFDSDTLRSYVREDLALINEFNPDLIVGDLRLSLSVSARVACIPYATIMNASWSPYSNARFPVPDHPLIRFTGVAAAQLLFRLVRPIAFAYHSKPMNRVRADFGLPQLHDVRQMFADADYTLYADLPDLVSTTGAPSTHRYIGPVLWSPNVDKPTWWYEFGRSRGRPIIYASMGTSGDVRVLPRIVEALSTLPVDVMIATAGRWKLDSAPENIFVADYLPGEEACERAQLVICNGGSPATYQAIAYGKPVLGIPTNIDQFANMDLVTRAGLGRSLRASGATVPRIRSLVMSMLNEIDSAGLSKNIEQISRKPATEQFREFVEEVLS